MADVLVWVFKDTETQKFFQPLSDSGNTYQNNLWGVVRNTTTCVLGEYSLLYNSNNSDGYSTLHNGLAHLDAVQTV